ncbi:lipoyl(octanoyl) transferase LipB [Kallotenue papyrolyticum]|uniref:lipoyl(octanoyl) transferase LipB n=1 Tax=Kallotenue papyrolyticum TaxID=1325125 RepID=UPI000492C580|nr:lipoyl(octanoyl) transferase LipB [Kallotenue papyrolyticum]
MDRYGTVRWLGRIDYRRAWELQKELAARRAAETIPDTLLLLEHPHTYTFGSRGRRAHEHLLVPRAELEAAGITVLDVDRGGDVTYHGPGQLVGYPILRLADYGLDAVSYIRAIEAALIEVAASYGLPAGRIRHLSGVWVGDQKLAAIGTKVDVNGITQHGFALNVTTDLSYFAKIIPCGIRHKGVASLAGLLGRAVAMDEVIERTVAAWERVFGVELQWRSDQPHAHATQALSESYV